MPHFSPHLARQVARCHGIVTREDLLADGLSIDQIRRKVRIASLVACHTGVYRLATSPDTFESRCAAACLADPTAVVSGRAAASLWGFRHVRQPDEPIVLIGHDRNPLNTGVTLRRTSVLDDEDRVRRDDGIVVASPPRTWFDCARDLDDATFEATTEWVLDRHTSLPTLWRTVRRLDGRGRPGLARVRRVLSRRSAWQRPAGSKLELRVLRALQRAGLPELVRQHRLELPNKLVNHPDGADPSIRWAIEIDHVTWHGGRADAQCDKGRDRGLRRLGWQVERVTDRELRVDFAGAIREVVELYHLRRTELAA
jgi:very-short-patch-repair endonuclease